MRVYCKECGQRGRITKTNQLSSAVADLYCQCIDAECGHRWVATLSFSHTLTDSSLTISSVIVTLIQSLDEKERQKCIKQILT
ncbi:ogr/Delta-like zinc finger family protein [Aeromonas salmonicida]|uniref:ogr/Delta-like zinc finger family protein n=1 Tax=Aeromonas salmonicida TaxID=645 RepID=UPI003D3BDE77